MTRDAPNRGQKRGENGGLGAGSKIGGADVGAREERALGAGRARGH